MKKLVPPNARAKIQTKIWAWRTQIWTTHFPQYEQQYLGKATGDRQKTWTLGITSQGEQPEHRRVLRRSKGQLKMNRMTLVSQGETMAWARIPLR